jgi:hypothetical protein
LEETAASIFRVSQDEKNGRYREREYRVMAMKVPMVTCGPDKKLFSMGRFWGGGHVGETKVGKTGKIT